MLLLLLLPCPLQDRAYAASPRLESVPPERVLEAMVSVQAHGMFGRKAASAAGLMQIDRAVDVLVQDTGPLGGGDDGAPWLH